MNTIEDDTSDVTLCNSDNNGQGLGEAANNFGNLHLGKDGAKPQQEHSSRYCAADITSKDGAKPQQEYSPEQRSGYRCINKLARCKRKRKKESIPIHQQKYL